MRHRSLMFLTAVVAGTVPLLERRPIAGAPLRQEPEPPPYEPPPARATQWSRQEIGAFERAQAKRERKAAKRMAGR